MVCRVGITTRPEQRKQEWKRKVDGLRNWQILAKRQNREDAQNLENQYAKQYGCKASGGGNDPDGPNETWSVYRFDYDSEK